ncbi:MAG: helix-turn-helix transcriptional regulator [Bacteroidota bacterium]
MRFLSNEPGNIPHRGHPEIPSSLQHELLPSARSLFYNERFGHYLIQEIMGKDYIAWQYDFFAVMPVTLVPVSEESILAFVYILKGHVSCELLQKEALEMEEGNYYLMQHSAGLGHKVYLPKIHLQVFHIALFNHYLHDLCRQYPEIKITVKQLLNGHQKIIQPIGNAISPAGRQILNQIMQCTKTGIEREIILQARIRDMVLQYVIDTTLISKESHYLDGKNRLTEADMSAIINIKPVLDELTGKPLSIAEVSKKAAVSTIKLTTGFKKAFGLTLYRYQLYVRMDMARMLLLKNDDPIAVIAYYLGYETPSSFSEKFKALFGITPLQYRKKYKH